MSICTGIGNGIGGAIGKWGAGLGSALGLAAVVDTGTRLYTGYGLLETLSVPYIECPDGSFASAIEWYGSGLKCPIKKPDPTRPTTTSPEGGKNQHTAAEDYENLINALGGSVYAAVGMHFVLEQIIGTRSPQKVKSLPNHYSDKPSTQNDKIGNIITYGSTAWENYGFGGLLRASRAGGYTDQNDLPSGWERYFLNERLYGTVKNMKLAAYGSQPDSTGTYWGTYFPKENVWTLLGVVAEIPSNYEKAPPAARLPPPRGFSRNPPPKKEDCEETPMSCPCITPADIEAALRKVLGLRPFSPEQLIRSMGAKMYALPGPSVIPIVPSTLVDAIAGLVAANYMRAGYARYPVLMPSSLINDDSILDALPTQPLENFAEWFEWMIKQQDAVQGEWPVELAIVDGAKRQPLKFENISEAFAELTGLMIQTATDADAAVAVGAHAAVAATKAQAAAVIAQKNAECIIKFFGIRTGYASVFVETVITPMDSDNRTFNLKKFLTPSRQAVIVYTDNDPFDFQPVLDRILRNTEIAKSAVALDAKSGLVGDFTRNQRKYDENQSKRAAEKELEKLETSLKAQNPDFKVRIKVDTIASNDDIAGDKFVIKRPKTNE